MAGQKVNRISDERLAEMIAEIEALDASARENWQAHGDYGEDFGALAFDLRDARTQIADLNAELYTERMTCPVCKQYGDGCRCGGLRAIVERAVAAGWSEADCRAAHGGSTRINGEAVAAIADRVLKEDA